MKQVAIVTDSVSCLTRELVQQYDIDIIPLSISANGACYRDWVDITPTEAYRLFLKDPGSFKTSAASPGDCLEVFRKAGRRAPNVVCITLSSRLSVMHKVALEAEELAGVKLPGIKVTVIDSETATPAEGMVALAAARAAAEGKTVDEVIKAAEAVKEKVGAIFYLDTIRHVYRSGRIPRLASSIGSALNIKPILTVASTVNFKGIARSRRHGLKRLIELMRQQVGSVPVHVAVTHAYAPEEAEKLYEMVSREFDCVELWLSEFSPVMGYACGTGTVGVAFYPA